MSADDLPPYEPWMRELIERERELEDLPKAVEKRILDRVLLSAVPVGAGLGAAKVAASAGSGSATTAGGATTAAGATAKVLVGAKAIAIASGATGLVLGATMGVVTYRAVIPPRERVVTRIEYRDRKTDAAPAKVEEVSPAEPKTSVPVVDAGVKTERPRAPKSEVAAETRDLDLAAENALIRRMQSALARGQWEESLRTAEEHEQKFAKGRFLEEREALAIQALVKLGRRDRARARAERFYRRYPSSLLTRVVRAAVQAP